MCQKDKALVGGQCENLQDGQKSDCEKLYDCCDCGTDDQDDGCGCRYCWSCNACDTCLEKEYD